MRQLLVALILLISPCLAYPESIEGFSHGGSADEIVSRIGEPTVIDGPTFETTSRSWVWSWEYTRYGALFEVEAQSQGGNKQIRSLTIVSPCPWKLSSGLGIGDSADRILGSYPKVHKTTDTLWFVPGDKRNLTGFELNGKRIKSIFIGAKAKKRRS